MKYIIKKANNNDKKKWDEFLYKKKLNVPINYFSWSKVIKETFLFQTPLFLIVRDKNNKICGTFSGFIVHTFFGKKSIYSTRFGLVANNQKVASKIFNYLENFAKKENIQNVLITTGFKKFSCNYFTFKKISMVIELENNIDWLWNKFSSKTRNAIRRGYKNNFILSNDLKYLKNFYLIYKKKMYEKSVLPLPLKFFRKMFAYNPNNSRLFTAIKDNRVISGLILINSEDTAQYIYAASNDLHYHNSNHYLLWEVLKKMYKENIKLFDMTESTVNSGVYYFKKFFGGKERTVYYYKLPFPDNLIKKNNKELGKKIRVAEKHKLKISEYLKAKILINFSRII